MDTEIVENVENVENIEIETDATPVVEEPKKRRGRPPGSKNRKSSKKDKTPQFLREEDLPDPSQLPVAYALRVLKMFDAIDRSKNGNED